MHPTSYLVNEKIAFDAGALTTLSLSEQSQISHILLSHSHIDHLYTIPFLLDNLFSEIKTPIVLYGSSHTIQCLKEHLFNNRLWPDFTSLSNENSLIIDLKTIEPGETIEIEGLRITPALMVHTVQCFGYLVDDGEASGFIAGDTCSMEKALPLIQKAKNLKIIILEASFPDRMEKIAELSRHLTTKTFAREAKTLPDKARILATHMKPDCLGEIQIEIADLGLDNVTLIEQGATYRLGTVPAK